MTTGGEALVLGVTGFELLFLFYGWRLEKVSWEQLWVLVVEAFSYAVTVLTPEAPFATLFLLNGRELPWLRYVGWLLTCPVLLMGIVSLTTVGGGPPTVRMVPLLVANLLMIMLGVTSATLEEKGPQRIIYGFGVGAGGVVLMSAAQCFHALGSHVLALHSSGAEPSTIKRLRWTSAIFAASFFIGWLLFPVAFTLGPLGPMGGAISAESEALFYVFGDLLAKNTFVGAGALFKHYLLLLLPPDDDPEASFTTVGREASSAAPGSPEAAVAAAADRRKKAMGGRRPSLVVATEMLGERPQHDPKPAVPGTPSQCDVCTTATTTATATTASTPQVSPSRSTADRAASPRREVPGAAAEAHEAASEWSQQPPRSRRSSYTLREGGSGGRNAPEAHEASSEWQQPRSRRSSRIFGGGSPKGSPGVSPSLLRRPPYAPLRPPSNAPCPPPPPPPASMRKGWLSCGFPVARTQPMGALHAPPDAGSTPCHSEHAADSAAPAAAQTPESVAIAAAIAAALATLENSGGRGGGETDQISQALRYIAENPELALASMQANRV